jgi:hypothetical protein
MRRTGIRRLKGFLERTAVGRVLGLVLLDEEGKDWVSKVGGKRVRITEGEITVQERLLSAETKSDGHGNDSAEAEDIEDS